MFVVVVTGKDDQEEEVAVTEEMRMRSDLLLSLSPERLSTQIHRHAVLHQRTSKLRSH